MSAAVRYFLECEAHGQRAESPEWAGRGRIHSATHLSRDERGAAAVIIGRALKPSDVVGQCRECVESGFPADLLLVRIVRHTERGASATKCGPRCRGAKRADCDCVCKGEFHGVRS